MYWLKHLHNDLVRQFELVESRLVGGMVSLGILLVFQEAAFLVYVYNIVLIFVKSMKILPQVRLTHTSRENIGVWGKVLIAVWKCAIDADSSNTCPNLSKYSSIRNDDSSQTEFPTAATLTRVIQAYKDLAKKTVGKFGINDSPSSRKCSAKIESKSFWAEYTVLEIQSTWATDTRGSDIAGFKSTRTLKPKGGRKSSVLWKL